MVLRRCGSHYGAKADENNERWKPLVQQCIDWLPRQVLVSVRHHLALVNTAMPMPTREFMTRLAPPLIEAKSAT